MAQYKKVYGWVITIVESANTIPSLFRNILEWRGLVEDRKSQSARIGSTLKLANHNARGELWDFFLTDTKRNLWGQRQSEEDYNLCHFWTNFEIGDLRFFRGQEYQSLFNFLDRKGGFYTERVSRILFALSVGTILSTCSPR